MEQPQYFYRLMIFGRPACGCLSFDNPILKTEYNTHITYVFPSCHDMGLVWNEEFLSATCELKNIIPYDIVVERIDMIDGDFKFEKVDYKLDWRILVDRYTYEDAGSGIHLNRSRLNEEE